MKARMLASDVVFYAVEVEAHLDLPLAPAPLYLRRCQPDNELMPEPIFDGCLRHCGQYTSDPEVMKWFSVAAFHLVLGYSKFLIVTRRVQFPAIALLKAEIIRKLEQAFRAYQQHRSLTLKSTTDSETRSFLAKSASVLSAACA